MNTPILEMDRDRLLDVVAWMIRRVAKLEEDGKKERAELFSLLRAKR